MNWSHTRIATYLSCPLAYKLSYIQGEPNIATAPMRRGRDMHEAFQRYAEHCWRKGRKPLKSDFDAGRDIAAGYPDCRDAIERWVETTLWEWGTVLPGETSPVEVMYEGQLPGGAGLFRGRIDLLQRQEGAADDDPFAESADEWWVTDWKTGYSIAATDEPPLQLLAYAWLVQQNYPEAREFLLRIACAGSPWSPRPWHLRGDLGWVGKDLAAIVTRIEADRDPEANVGAACQNCGYILACPKATSVTVDTLATLAADPAEWGNAVALMEATIKAHKALLKAAAQERGPVPVHDGRAWGFHETLSHVPASARQFGELLEQEGMDPYPYLGVTASQYRKAIEAADDNLLPALDRLAVEKRRVTFGLQGTVNDEEDPT